MNKGKLIQLIGCALFFVGVFFGGIILGVIVGLPIIAYGEMVSREETQMHKSVH